MRNSNLYIIGLIAILSLTSCEKKDISFCGKLTVSFTNYVDDLDIRIYSIQNESYPIYDNPIDNKNVEIELNAGNYIISPYSSSIFYPKIAFQISPDKTTSVYYDSSNNGSVKY